MLDAGCWTLDAGCLIRGYADTLLDTLVLMLAQTLRDLVFDEAGQKLATSLIAVLVGEQLDGGTGGLGMQEGACGRAGGAGGRRRVREPAAVHAPLLALAGR
jgi:hypothetical protein